MGVKLIKQEVNFEGEKWQKVLEIGALLELRPCQPDSLGKSQCDTRDWIRRINKTLKIIMTAELTPAINWK
jgi:hypothetical protein